MKGELNRKFTFFIGATRQDLGDVRKKLIETVLEAKHIPSGMELWAAGSDPLLTDITKYLEQCDAHIIVLGARYGEYVAGEEISFTEWEYRKSIGKRPILVFLLQDAEFKSSREEIILGDTNEREKEGKLNKFREELRKLQFCKFFNNTETGIEELGRLCVTSIHQLIDERKLSEDAGWIKASSQEVLTLRQIIENKFLEKELKRMREFSIVGQRVMIDQISKEIQSQIFWRTMQGRIRRHGFKNLFFESGSTLAYMSETFENFILKNDKEVGSWHVWTNNVLTLLQLLLYTDADIRRFPPSAPDPDDKYGAIFPGEWKRLAEPPFPKPRELHEGEAEAVEEMRNKLREFGEKTLILATSSGWDLDHKWTDFQGPHVGSHPNMLFKRALFTTGHPVIIFLSAEKLGDPFEIGKCYPIFGPDLPLTEVLTKYPLALCIGYDRITQSPTRRKLESETRKERNDPSNLERVLNKLGFNVIYTKTEEEKGAIIAGNLEFLKLLPND